MPAAARITTSSATNTPFLKWGRSRSASISLADGGDAPTWPLPVGMAPTPEDSAAFTSVSARLCPHAAQKDERSGAFVPQREQKTLSPSDSETPSGTPTPHRTTTGQAKLDWFHPAGPLFESQMVQSNVTPIRSTRIDSCFLMMGWLVLGKDRLPARRNSAIALETSG